jgi:hypothetical protein
MAPYQADIISVIVDASFWTSALFVPVVSAYWAWWKHPYGRAAMSIDILLALAFLPGELRRVFGISVSSTGFGWFEIVVLGLIPVRTAWLALSIWRLQREGAAKAR